MVLTPAPTLLANTETAECRSGRHSVAGIASSLKVCFFHIENGPHPRHQGCGVGLLCTSSRQTLSDLSDSSVGVGASKQPLARTKLSMHVLVDRCGGATCAVSKLPGLRLASNAECTELMNELQRARQAAAGTPHSTRSTVPIDLHLTLTPTKTPTDTHWHPQKQPRTHPDTHTSTTRAFPALGASDAPELRFRKPRSHRQARRWATGPPVAGWSDSARVFSGAE